MFWKVKTQSTKFYLNFNLQRGVLESQNPKYQVLPEFQFLGGGWGVLESQNPKYQVLSKFQFSGRGVLESQNPKCQDLSKFQFGGRCSGKSKPKVPRSVQISILGGRFWKVKTPSAKISPNFNFGGGILNQIPEQGCSVQFWSKISGSLASLCITDSLSHTMYVETNDIHTNLDPVVSSCCPSSPRDLTSKAKLLPSTI